MTKVNRREFLCRGVVGVLGAGVGAVVNQAARGNYPKATSGDATGDANREPGILLSKLIHGRHIVFAENLPDARTLLSISARAAMGLIGEDEFPQGDLLIKFCYSGSEESRYLDSDDNLVEVNPHVNQLFVPIPKNNGFEKSSVPEQVKILVPALIRSLVEYNLAKGDYTKPGKYPNELATEYGKALFRGVIKRDAIYLYVAHKKELENEMNRFVINESKLRH